MKREEIKVYYADLEGQLYEMNPFPGHDTATFIRKSEADKVMDALEAKINELGEDYRKISAMYIAEQTKAAKYEQRIKELEEENKSLHSLCSYIREVNSCMCRDLAPNGYIPMTDAERKESKILEAIYHYGCKQIDDVNKAYIDFVENFAELILNNESANINMAFLEWRDWFNEKAKAKGITLEPMADVAKRFTETKKANNRK